MSRRLEPKDIESTEAVPLLQVPAPDRGNEPEAQAEAPSLIVSGADMAAAMARHIVRIDREIERLKQDRRRYARACQAMSGKKVTGGLPKEAH